MYYQIKHISKLAQIQLPYTNKSWNKYAPLQNAFGPDHYHIQQNGKTTNGYHNSNGSVYGRSNQLLINTTNNNNSKLLFV